MPYMRLGREVSRRHSLCSLCTNLCLDEAEKAMRPSKRMRGIHEVLEVKGKSTETKAAPKSKADDKSKSSSRPLTFSHVEVPSPKDVKKQLSRRVEAIEVSSSTEDQSDGDEERPVQRLSRKVSKMAVYVDSDSEEERPTKAARGSKMRARSESPDFI